MANNIDQLRTEVDKFKKWLDELKNNVSLSDTEKKSQAETLKAQAETIKQKIQDEIDSLGDRTDEESKKKKEEAETLLNSLNEITSLYASIINAGTTESVPSASVDNPETSAEEKWFFWKAWDWIWEQWDGVRSGDKRKEEPWKNLLRTTWFIATWVWAVALAYKWVKKLWNRAFGDDEEEEEGTEEKSKKKIKSKSTDDTPFWDTWYWKALKRTWIWTAAYYISHWIYTKNRWLNDLFDWEKGKKIGFEAALEYCKWDIANQDNKEGMSYGLDLKYHEDTWEIEAYGERVKIDKEKRRIPWIWLGEVEFKKYEHMINAAILIAYLKKQYSWQCKNNNPFHLTWSWQWDINVNASNGDEEATGWTGNWWRIVWVTAGWIAGIVTWIFTWAAVWTAVWVTWWVVWYAAGSIYDHDNIMNNHMPELDDNFWKQSLQAYLNHMNCRQERNQTQEDITESPIKNEVWECVKRIQEENPDMPALWGRRAFDAIPDAEHPNRYTIKAYGREIYAEITDMNDGFASLQKIFKYKEMRILWISWWNPAIKTDMEQWKISGLKLPLQEWLYMSALLWKLLDNYHHKWNEYPRFEYTWKAVKLITTGFWIWGDNNGMYFSDSWLDTMALSWDVFEKNMPTLFKEENRDRFLEFINKWITDEFNVPIWKKNE